MSEALVTPEQAFQLLADASGVHHPHPDRENRGLCPAHGDQHNPALVFRVGDTGNLVAYCHSQHCSIERLAQAIGVTVGSFFVGGGRRYATPITVDWQHKPVLELLKMVPFEYDFDTTVECVFRTLDIDLSYAETPLRNLTKTELFTLGGIWLEPGYSYGSHGDWWDVYHVWLSKMHSLDRETRIDPHAQVSAVPHGSFRKDSDGER